MSRFVVLSGCSGGGKSTLLDELARRGYATVPEPGRRIVVDELRGSGAALPWVDAEAFVRRAIDLALRDLAVVRPGEGWVFFDRGLIDAVVSLRHLTGCPDDGETEQLRGFHRQVFLVPPWPEIYVNDAERRHDLVEAVEEYGRLAKAYPAMGYDVVVLPEVGVVERADLVLEQLDG